MFKYILLFWFGLLLIIEIPMVYASPPSCDLVGPNPVCANSGSYQYSTPACIPGVNACPFTFKWTIPPADINSGTIIAGDTTRQPWVQALNSGSFTLNVEVHDQKGHVINCPLVVGVSGVGTITASASTICAGGTVTFHAVPSVGNYPSLSPHWNITYNPNCNDGECVIIAPDGSETATLTPSGRASFFL